MDNGKLYDTCPKGKKCELVILEELIPGCRIGPGAGGLWHLDMRNDCIKRIWKYKVVADNNVKNL